MIDVVIPAISPATILLLCVVGVLALIISVLLLGQHYDLLIALGVGTIIAIIICGGVAIVVSLFYPSPIQIFNISVGAP